MFNIDEAIPEKDDAGVVILRVQDGEAIRAFGPLKDAEEAERLIEREVKKGNGKHQDYEMVPLKTIH